MLIASIKTLSLGLALILATPSATAAVPNHSESKTYTISSTQELKSLALNPGDEVVWTNGEYTDLKITFKGEGDKKHPITFRPETPGGVVLKGASGITLSGAYLVAEGFNFSAIDNWTKHNILTFAKGSSNCRISNCVIDGTDSQETTLDTKWVNIYGSHNEISHCNFIDKKNMGTTLVVWPEEGITPAHTIAYNIFTRPFTHFDERYKAMNGQEAVRIGTSQVSMSDANCVVKGNYFKNVYGEQAEIISDKTCGNIHEGNVFEACKGSLTLRHGNRCTVRGNFFRSNGVSNMGGVRIIGEDHHVENNVFIGLTGQNAKAAICVMKGEPDAALNGYWQVKNAVIRHNTFVACKQTIAMNIGGRSTQTLDAENVKIDKNTTLDEMTDKYDSQIEEIIKNAGATR